MKTIKHTYRIYAPIEDVWKALIDPKEIKKWGGGPAKMDDKKGTKFTLWGGQIYGTNLTVIPQKKLIQEWYSENWKQPSHLTFTLEQKTPTLTYVTLLHKNVPDTEARDIEQGWIEFYMGPLKDSVEKNPFA